MLKIVDSLASIDICQLMNVYAEGIRLTGKECYSGYPENLQGIYAEQDFYAYLEAFFMEPTARYALWLQDLRYVSALRIEKYHDGLLLNALETAPDARRNGFATMLIRSLLEYLRSCGSGKLYSHVNKKNIASFNLHIACGFSVVSEEAIYLDETVHPDSYTLLIHY